MSFRNTWVYKGTLGLLSIAAAGLVWNYFVAFTYDLPTYQGRTMTFSYSCANKPPGFGDSEARPMTQSPAGSEVGEASADPSATQQTAAGGR